MKSQNRNRLNLMYAGLLLLVGPLTLPGATRAISFGGSTGFAYSPTTLTVNVGDTVTWTGDFAMHPLASTTIPAGAAAFSRSSGTVFSYAVKVVGKYAYKCTLHAGMVGSFSAVSLSAKNSGIAGGTNGVRILAISGTGGISTRIIILSPVNGLVSVQPVLLNGTFAGKEQVTFVPAGSTVIELQKLPAGTYLLAVAFNGRRSLIKRVIVN